MINKLIESLEKRLEKGDKPITITNEEAKCVIATFHKFKKLWREERWRKRVLRRYEE